jgi:hypothetical protein
LPGWLERRGDKLVVVPDKVRTVETIFRLCVDGYGLSSIVKHLTAARIAPFGGAKHWSKAYLHKVLTGRAVLGEHQPMRGDEPDGPPILGYYPAIIDKDTWEAVRGALKGRKEQRGPIGKGVATLFGGLLRAAGTGEPIYIAVQTRGIKSRSRQRKRVLVAASSLDGASASVSFPNDIFEAAILSLLKEVDPADVLGEEPADETTAIAAALARVNLSIESIEDEMDSHGESAILYKRLRKREAERRDLAGRLAVARQRERTPRTAAFAEASTLFDVAVGEERRLRLRVLLRQLIDSIWILIVPRKSHRLCCADLFHRRRQEGLPHPSQSSRILS